MNSSTFLFVSITVLLVNLQPGSTLSPDSTEEANFAPKQYDVGCHCIVGSCECHIEIDAVGQHISFSANVSVVMPDRLVNLTVCALGQCTHAIVNQDQKPLCIELLRRHENAVPHAVKLCAAVKDLEITQTEVSAYLEFTGKILFGDIGPFDSPVIHIAIPQYERKHDISARNDSGLNRSIHKGK